MIGETMEKVEKLYRDYLQSKISLQSLQFQLEPILGNFDSVSKADEQFIKSVTNNLELIIYTIPEELQKDEVIGLFPEIFDYIREKENSLPDQN
jgi:hypothetical protein